MEPLLSLASMPSGADREKHESILAAAERLFVRYGFKKTTIEDVATEAGVGKGTIYSYFRGKEELLLAYSDRCWDQILAEARRTAARPGHLQVRLAETMKAILLGMWDQIHRGPHGEEIFNALFPTLLERHQRCIEAGVGLVGSLLGEAQAAGTIRPTDIDRTAILVWKAFRAWGPPYSILTGTRDEMRDGIEAMARLLYDGLR